jgi:hypothetical protein
MLANFQHPPGAEARSFMASSGTAAALYKARNLANHRMTLQLLEGYGIRGFAKVGYGDQLTQSHLEKQMLQSA